MAKTKGPIYKDEGQICREDLLTQLGGAVDELGEKMRASIPISRSGSRIGFGVDRTQRGISADLVISIARAIKGLKGW